MLQEVYHFGVVDENGFQQVRTLAKVGFPNLYCLLLFLFLCQPYFINYFCYRKRQKKHVKRSNFCFNLLTLWWIKVMLMHRQLKNGSKMWTPPTRTSAQGAKHQSCLSRFKYVFLEFTKFNLWLGWTITEIVSRPLLESTTAATVLVNSPLTGKVSLESQSDRIPAMNVYHCRHHLLQLQWVGLRARLHLGYRAMQISNR